MVTDGATRGVPSTAGDPTIPAREQQILDFLASAPEHLRSWAEEQAALIRQAASETPLAGDGSPKEDLPTDADPADLALAEIDEEDDDLRPAPRVFTPKDRAVPVPRAQQRPRSLWPLVGVIGVAAMVFAIYQAGLPAQPPASHPSVASRPDTSARIAELETTLKTDPDNLDANLELGVLVFNNGETSRAEQLWTKVTALDPNNPQAWFNLGFVHLSKDPPDEAAARLAWEKVATVAPDSDLARTARTHAEALAKRSASATPSQKAR